MVQGARLLLVRLRVVLYVAGQGRRIGKLCQVCSCVCVAGQGRGVYMVCQVCSCVCRGGRGSVVASRGKIERQSVGFTWQLR
jgi:hypothetical protein